jgi:hypothetical protein
LLFVIVVASSNVGHFSAYVFLITERRYLQSKQCIIGPSMFTNDEQTGHGVAV